MIPTVREGLVSLKHFCLIYKNKDDMADVVKSFFEEAQKAHEFCLYIDSGDADDICKLFHEEIDNIEIIHYRLWYLRGGIFNAEQVISALRSKKDEVIARGFSGLRIAGDLSWLDKNYWKDFMRYETQVANCIRKSPVKALCAYPLGICDTITAIDITRTHQLVLLQGDNGWSMLDNSESYHVSKLLRQQEIDTANLINNNPDAIIIVDQSGIIRFSNPAAQILLGSSEHALLGQSFGCPVIGEDTTKIEINCSRGECRLVEMRVIDSQWENSRACMILLTDITDKDNLERSLVQEKNKAQQLLDIVGVMVVTLDSEGKVTLVNQKTCEIIGLKAGEIINKDWATFVPERLISRMQASFKRLVSGEFQSVTSYRNPIVNAKGEERIVDWHNTVIRDEQGNITGSLSSGQDVTEHIRDAEKMKNLARFPAENPSPVMRISEDGKLLFANPASIVLLDAWKIQEGEYIPDAWRQTIKEVIKSGNTQQGEFPFSNRYFLLTIAPAPERRYANLYGLDITERKRAEAAVQEGLNKLQKTFDGIVRTLSKILEVRDPYTAGHQRRVAQLSQAIALKMELGEDRSRGIYIAGLLHDIGKITTPAEILAKPGILTEVEFELIKIHTKIGYDILKNTDFPYPVAQVALQHHERLNGTGYPNGLSGDAICLEARVLAVADVVEAMASHRPYRTAFGLGKALEEIHNNRGILYDANSVDACMSLFVNNLFKFEKDTDPHAIN